MFRWPSGDEETEDERLKRWQKEDPIALQDSYNTSNALVEYCKSNDFEGMAKLVDEADYGEFLFAHTVQAFIIAVSNLQVDIVRKFLDNRLDLTYDVFTDVLHMGVEALWKDPSNYRVTRALQMIHMLTAGGRGTGGIPVDSLRERDGFTPLCSACVVGFIDVAKCLLSLKADPDMITRDNVTPLEIATECGHEEIVAFLKARNASSSAANVLSKIRPDRCGEIRSGQAVFDASGPRRSNQESGRIGNNNSTRKASHTCRSTDEDGKDLHVGNGKTCTLSVGLSEMD